MISRHIKKLFYHTKYQLSMAFGYCYAYWMTFPADTHLVEPMMKEVRRRRLQETRDVVFSLMKTGTVKVWKDSEGVDRYYVPDHLDEKTREVMENKKSNQN